MRRWWELWKVLHGRQEIRWGFWAAVGSLAHAKIAPGCGWELQLWVMDDAGRYGSGAFSGPLDTEGNGIRGSTIGTDTGSDIPTQFWPIPGFTL